MLVGGSRVLDFGFGFPLDSGNANQVSSVYFTAGPAIF